MTEPIHAASVWKNPDAPRYRIETGSLGETDTGRFLRVSRKVWRDTGLPKDIEDWPITVTTSEGEHINSEVATQDQTPAAIRLELLTGPIIFP